MVGRCGARFFTNCEGTPDNACQKEPGHPGDHLTGVSEPFICAGVEMRMTISFGEKTPLYVIPLVFAT